MSHLDIQRLFQRAFRRAGVPLAYSKGFNPHPQLSFATALSTGVTSECEWLDVELEKEMDPEQFISGVNETLPSGFAVLEARAVDDRAPSLTSRLDGATYTAMAKGEARSAEALHEAAIELLKEPIIIQKKTKGGIKPFDIRPQVESVAFEAEGENMAITVRGALNASGSLNVDALLAAIMEKAGFRFDYILNRDSVAFAPEDAF